MFISVDARYAYKSKQRIFKLLRNNVLCQVQVPGFKLHAANFHNSK